MPYPEKAADATLLATHDSSLGDAAYYQRPSGVDVIVYRAQGFDIPSVVECPRTTKAGAADSAIQVMAQVTRDIEDGFSNPVQARSRAIGRSLDLTVSSMGLDRESGMDVHRVTEAVKEATATKPIEPIESGPFMAGFEAKTLAEGRNGTYLGFEHDSGLRAIVVLPTSGDARVVTVSRESWDTLENLPAEAVRLDEGPFEPGPPQIPRDADFVERSRIRAFVTGIQEGQEVFEPLRARPDGEAVIAEHLPSPRI